MPALTAEFVKTAPVGSYWDDRIKGLGFGLRVQPTGTRSFFFEFRDDGRQRRMKLGTWPLLSPAEAFEEAKRLRRRVGRGEPVLPAKDETATDERREKFLSFIARGAEPTCYLYRHYHPNGDLLYVGVSLDALARLNRHFDRAEWRNHIHRIEVEPFETREEALEAERLAIQQEFPKHNSMHNSRARLGREIATLGRRSKGNRRGTKSTAADPAVN